ncbi:MAG: lysophospholipid acyltransferase family protein [Pseudomonadota bacterium]
MIFIRAMLFNIFFYGFTIVACLILWPVVFMSRNAILKTSLFFVNGVEWIERNILGLTFEIRGKENIPEYDTYIVAAKHQSAYETMKLHHLFDDPTIVCKRELLNIPIFGMFLKKIGVIPINRGNKDEAIAAIIEGAQQMREKKRPIVIFPQGTRVNVNTTTKDKPYKGGIVKMYKNTDLPILPLALNSGMFWGRNSFIKKPGKVIFEFLPVIESGLPDKKVMKALEDRVEERSHALMQEAQQEFKHLGHTKLLEPPAKT